MIGPVRTVNFSITSRCNRRCPSCVSGLQRDHRVKRDQTLDEIEAAARILGYVPIISLYGGEPSFHADFVRLVARMRDIFWASQITVQTNGYGLRHFPEAFLAFDSVIASVYTAATYPACPSNAEEIEVFRRLLRHRGCEGKLTASEVVHLPDSPPFPGGPCYRQEMPTIAYSEGKLYRCCVGDGPPGAVGIPLTVDWRDRIDAVPIPCETCLLSTRRAA